MNLGALEEMKFNLNPVECMISNKTSTQTHKPSKSYIEITFTKDSLFNYIVLQNFYTYSITVKQFKSSVAQAGDPKEAKKNDNNWITVLKNYQLMRNAHFETDAQNWHIIGTEFFNSKFDRSNIKFIRIYLR